MGVIPYFRCDEIFRRKQTTFQYKPYRDKSKYFYLHCTKILSKLDRYKLYLKSQTDDSKIIT